MLLATGCGKDDPEPDSSANPPAAAARNCQLIRASSHVYGYEYEYEYNAAGQITKAILTSPLTYLSNYDVVEYNSFGFLSKVTKYKPNNVFLEYRIYEYTPDSLVKKDTKYTRTNPADSTYIGPFSFNEYSYDASKRLTKITYYSSDQPATPRGSTSYTYRPDGSILEEQSGNTLNSLATTTEYWFTNSKAPVQKVAYFDLWETLKAPSAGIIFNKVPATIRQTNYDNNGNVSSQYTFNYTYTHNADGYPLQQAMGNPGQQPQINTWTYTCQ